MNERVAVAPSKAATLAAWTRLPFEKIKDYYIGEAVTSARNWKTLEADPTLATAGLDPEKQLILLAFEEAENHGFLYALALRISRLERERGRTDEDVRSLLTELGPGQMQAMTNRAAGLMELAIMPDLFRVGEASAYVMSGNAIVGTAFLVAPDLVLTSAHVVLSIDGNGDFAGKLKPQLTFVFKSGKRDAQTPSVQRAAHGDEPVMFALPHGRPPDRLERKLGPTAAKNLDYALVRLSSQVSHVTPLDISSPISAEDQRRCFVIGYSGGTAAMFDVDLVNQIDKQSARIMHLANTIAGMSGSCCVGPKGTPVGLHEGGFFRLDANGKVALNEKNQQIVDHNRAVCLTNIRDAMRAGRSDPLLSRPRAPGYGIYDSNLLVAWHRSGLRLAGRDLEPKWTESVAKVLGEEPAAIRGTLGFHPWFKRQDLENWIDKKNTATDRIAYVNGPPGTGKSFSAHILAAKLDYPERDLLVLTPTQTTAWSWSEAIAKLPRTDAGDAHLRTSAGAVRYEDVGSVIAGLRGHGGDRTTMDAPLFVVIDFEDANALGSQGPPWHEFIKQLASQPWVRVMIIGLSESERATLDGILENDRATEDVYPSQINLDHAGLEELTQFLLASYRGRGEPPPPRSKTQEQLGAWSPERSLRGTRGELQTAEAVLVALTIYKATIGVGAGGG